MNSNAPLSKIQKTQVRLLFHFRTVCSFILTLLSCLCTMLPPAWGKVFDQPVTPNNSLAPYKEYINLAAIATRYRGSVFQYNEVSTAEKFARDAVGQTTVKLLAELGRPKNYRTMRNLGSKSDGFDSPWIYYFGESNIPVWLTISSGTCRSAEIRSVPEEIKYHQEQANLMVNCCLGMSETEIVEKFGEPNSTCEGENIVPLRITSKVGSMLGDPKTIDKTFEFILGSSTYVTLAFSKGKCIQTEISAIVH